MRKSGPTTWPSSRHRTASARPHAAGINASTVIPAGLTLCAVDPGVFIFVLILTIVSGPLNGESGIFAADALLQTALGDG